MKDFILPDIGEGIVECELVEWLVKEGDRVEEDQPVADVMTDKAMVQIPAMHAGIVKKLYHQKGDIAKVHEPLFAMEVDGETSTEQAATESPAESASESKLQEQSSSAGKHVEDFILPDIGEGIVECEIAEWLVEEGDEVKEDQPVAEVMTDKAMVQIPAKYSGKVVKRYYNKGDIAKVHEPLFAIEMEGEEGEANPPSSSPAPAPQASNDKADIKPSGKASEKAEGGAGEPMYTHSGKPVASPAVRRLAKEQDVDLTAVKGSGKKGRILKKDVLGATSQTRVQPESRQPQAEVKATGGKRTEPIRGVRKVMAKQMADSVFTIPHFSVSDEIEMDALIEARAMLKPQFEKQGVKLSFMPFFIKAMSLALKQFPIVNAQVNDDCTELTYFDDHNIGMAVDSKMGLVVPNIKGVQNLSLFEVAQEAARLIDGAREGRISQEDMRGGTISISNIGVLGGTTATPVINKPESAIVALGKMQKLPRFDEQDNVKAVNLMHISWSGDHRIIDGATMVRFSNLWKSYLENPLSMLSELK
ncbi:Dihydrolipoyllysine-residue (2-methylpropanoyl)transferase [Saliniradius amylolyticus]|uniref:Dihydrolipoamide acetyltransferase component of pyruvate dehydrogenase complex n=1 Tax=Saliniradius amylolyticus TaxID=2183582 RepID=A0A2S2E2L5_9ALTE|nr:dihydrolipoyllysine-residue acetyltransferase [Saliniradius amylolyticus]AWL11874.1 Dihydrolipoyllysine-residue (2-methylpropanoyl)transferase [Saliniradius amylolyticus]